MVQITVKKKSTTKKALVDSANQVFKNPETTYKEDLTNILAEISVLDDQVKQVYKDNGIDAKLEEIENLKARAKSIALENASPEKLAINYGHLKLSLSKATQKRYVADIDALVDLMGIDDFKRIASVKLKDVDDYLTPDQKEKVLGTMEGSRSFSIK